MIDFNQYICVYRDGLINDTVPFWTRHAPDFELGGFLTFLDRDGSLYSTDKSVCAQAQMGWMYAKLYNKVEKRQEWLNFSKLALDFATNHCKDESGRLFLLVTRDGRPLLKSPDLHCEISIIPALCEYACAADDATARKQAKSFFNLLQQYQSVPGMLSSEWNSSTRPTVRLETYIGILAASQAMRKIDSASVYLTLADECIETIFSKFVKPDRRVVIDEVSPDGSIIDTPEGRCITPENALTAASIIMDEGELRGDRQLSLSALTILEWTLERAWDAQKGGIFNRVDIDRKPRPEPDWDTKLCGVHAVLISAVLQAFCLSGDERWLAWHRRAHDYAYSRFPDVEYGEWFLGLHSDGSLAVRCKGSLMKSPYQLSGMQIKCWKLLEDLKYNSLF